MLHLSVPPDPLPTPFLFQEAELCRFLNGLPAVWLLIGFVQVGAPAGHWTEIGNKVQGIYPSVLGCDGPQLKGSLLCETTISMQISLLWIPVTTLSP